MQLYTLDMWAEKHSVVRLHQELHSKGQVYEKIDYSDNIPLYLRKYIIFE